MKYLVALALAGLFATSQIAFAVAPLPTGPNKGPVVSHPVVHHPVVHHPVVRHKMAVHKPVHHVTPHTKPATHTVKPAHTPPPAVQ